MGNSKQPNIKPKCICRTMGAKLLIIVSIGVFFLTACLPQKAISPTPQPELSIVYLFTAETTFDKIEVKQGKLSYTYFEDVNNKCAQWIYQSPCWTEQDLQAKEASLSNSDINDLITLVLQTKFMELANSYGNAPPGQRYYPYSLKVKLGEVEKEVIYQSFPDAQPMPEAMEKLIDRLHELVKEKIQ
jgi:hypothetical protein